VAKTGLKSALFLDFDNVYIGLNELDSQQAAEMAEEPWQWLRRLLEHAGSQVKRDVLVRRAYLNPSGRVSNREGTWTYFSSIRPRLTRSGFEVIDCPSLTAAGKNAADIRMVMDVLFYMSKDTKYDEFIIASSDADFTPLLYHLRADNRRTVIVAAGQTSTAYREVADAVIDIGVLLEAGTLSHSNQKEVLEEISMNAETASHTAKSMSDDALVVADEALSYIQARDEPVLLAPFAQELLIEFELSEDSDGWFGHRTFSKFLQSINPNLQITGHYVWDKRRHRDPAEQNIELPDSIQRICKITDLPRLEKHEWNAIFAVLARYSSTKNFNLTECTAWCRDELDGEGIKIGRAQISYVVRSALHGDQPLNMMPAPTLEQIRSAVARATIARTRAANPNLSDEEENEFREWLGENRLSA